MRAGLLEDKSQMETAVCVLSPGPTQLVLFKISIFLGISEAEWELGNLTSEERQYSLQF